MRCPSCGAIAKKRSMRCPECGAYRNKNWVDSTTTTTTPPTKTTVPVEVATASAAPIETPKRVASTPSLIAFPGTKRAAVPEWRKELGERVREVQERRAREAALESGQAMAPDVDECATSAPLLELIPTEPQTINPIVVAALQRIQRAHAQPQFSGNAAVAAYVDYQEHPSIENAVMTPCTESEIFPPLEANVEAESVPAERVHNLSVVPSPVQTQEEVRSPAPRRMIRDDNDPALNYLDCVQAAVIVDARQHPSASVIRRIIGGITDLVVVLLLSLPIVSLVGLTTLAWEDSRVVAFAVATVLVVGFIYFTISTAFSGRTFGMRLLSLRIVDARTGMIPTGTQSAGRSLFFMLSLAAAGIALVYTFIDRDRRAVHDRFTRTAVVRA